MPAVSATGIGPKTAAVPGHAAGIAILDIGVPAADPGSLAAAIAAIGAGHAPEVAHDRNAVCHRVTLTTDGGAPFPAIVKRPRPGPQRTNPDATFAWEATVLARLPGAGIAAAPVLVARVAADGTHFLFSTELPGRHPDARVHPPGERQFAAILDAAFAMDRVAFMHYDLKAANILIDGDRAAFVDYEFARFGDAEAAFSAQTHADCADFNVSIDPHLPARSNVVNFEFRTLDRHLRELALVQSGVAADDTLRDWLRCKAVFHRRMALLLFERAEGAADVYARGGGITPAAARERLGAAARFEQSLDALFSQPRDVVLRVERALMAFRCAVFERRSDAARFARNIVVEALDADDASGPSLPPSYRAAVLRVLELVARSVHPNA